MTVISGGNKSSNKTSAEKQVYILPMVLITLILLLSSLTLLPGAIRITSSKPTYALPQATAQLSELNTSAIKIHLKSLTSMGSRVTGYPGYERATEYIVNYFRHLGLKVMVQEYDVVVPMDMGSYIELIWPNGTRKTINAYALWPNFIQACASPRGIEGKLVYVGSGELSELSGKDINGSIALMDPRSGFNWINVVNFGAKAILFLMEPITKYEALSKFSMTPIYVPRLLIPAKYCDELLKLAAQGGRVRVFSNIYFRKVKGKNIIAIINGTKYPDEVIILSTHYDTWSIAPSLAPGATDAIGVAFLLELARYYAVNRPLRTLWLVVYGGHWEGLAGAREFVEQYYFSRDVMLDKQKILLQIGLDLSSDNEGVTLLYVGHFYKCGAAGGSGAIESRYVPVLAAIDKFIIPRLRSAGIPENLLFAALKSIYWTGTEPEPYILDTEPATLSGGLAFTIMTSYAKRIWWGTPFDTLDNVNFEKLNTQFMISMMIVDYYLSTEDTGIVWSKVKPNRLMILGGDFKSYITFRGKVVCYNIESGWYKPVGRALVRIGVQPQLYYYPFANIIAMTDENGYFEVHGLPVSSVLPGNIYVEAWVVNGSAILYAPDMGVYGAKSFTMFFAPLAHPYNVTAVVFPCATIELFDVFDPITGRRGVIPDPTRSGEVNYFTSMSKVMPYDFDTFSEPIFYGYYYRPADPIALIFVRPGSRVAIVYQFGLIRLEHAGVLVNASARNPEGNGILAKSQGEIVRITFTAYRFAKDLALISKHRAEILTSHYVSSLTLGEALSKAFEYLNSTERFLREKNYEKAYYSALAARAWALRAYREHVMPLIYDLSAATIFYFSLIVPFAIFFERLIFHSEGKKRFVITILIAAFLVILFGVIHPAFMLVSNSALSLCGILVLFLLFFVLSIFAGETTEVMATEAERRLGKHRIAVSVAPFTHFSTLAIENMRRYKLRTALTMFTVITIVIATLSLTSTSSFLAVLTSSRQQETPYVGILVKKSYATPPKDVFDIYTPMIVYGIVNDRGVVSPRYWLYPPMLYPHGPMTYVMGPNASYPIKAFLGLTEVDSKKILGKALILGRTFSDMDYTTCLITTRQSQVLNVTVGDFIEWCGLKLLVVGVYEPQVLTGLKDLDGLGFAPIEPTTIPQYVPPGKKPPRVQYPSAWDFILVVPWKLVKDLGGYVASVAVYLNESVVERGEGNKLASELAKLFGNALLGVEGKAISYTGIMTWALMGWGIIVVVLVIGALNILIALIASLRERRRDVYIYSALGLSPRGAALMFMTESLVYAILASVLGYLAGIGLNLLLYRIGVLPSIYVVNYSSLSAVLSLMVTIGVILASAIYPISIAAKIITPSLERRWSPPTKPRGDKWMVPLPVTVATEAEVRGLLYYLYEYLMGEGKVTRYFTVLDVKPPKLETMSLDFKVLLAPREMNVTQSARLYFTRVRNRFSASISVERLTGDYITWRSSNYYFMDAIRKQLLLWRSLSKREREKYISYQVHTAAT